MNVHQRPIHRPGSPESAHDESAYAGFAAAQFRILKDYMTLAKLNTYSRVVTLANGVVITCQKSFNREDVFISVPPLAPYIEAIVKEVMVPLFISTPRKHGVNNGYSYQNIIVPMEAGDVQKPEEPTGKKTILALVETGDGSLDYPLDDSTDTSQSIGWGPFKEGSIPDPLLTEDLTVYRREQLFGNIDWIGKNTAGEGSPSNAPILTWKGPPGRSIPFDFNKAIDGLTTPDIVFDVMGADKFTCFGPNIYETGSILSVAPSSITAIIDGAPTPVSIDTPAKVSGAAYTEYLENDITKTALVCIVNNHYSQLTGFFEEVWAKKDGTWLKMSSVQVGRPSMIWAFNQSGNRATQGLSEYSLDVANGTAVLRQDANTEIVCTIDTASNSHSSSYAGSSVLWSDYKGDTRVFATVTATGGHEYESSSVNNSTMAPADIYVAGTQSATIAVSIYGTQATAVISGVYCPCEGVWSISNGTISQSGVIESTSGCGTVTVTYTCGDLEGSTSFKMSRGAWITTSCYENLTVTATNSCTTGGGAGDTVKIDESFGISSETYLLDGTYRTGSTCAPFTYTKKRCKSGIIHPICQADTCTDSGGFDEHGCGVAVTQDCSCFAVRTRTYYRWGCPSDTPAC